MDALSSLRAEMAERHIGNAALARALKVSKSLVTMWMKRNRVPGHASALAIQTWSNGRIPANDWVVRRPRRRAAGQPDRHP